MMNANTTYDENPDPRSPLGDIIALVLLLALFALCFAGCASKRVASVERSARDSVRVVERERVRVDSVTTFLHDSVYIYQRGDTVWRDRWHTLMRERWHTDTIRLTDTLRVVDVQTVETVVTKTRFPAWVGYTLAAVVSLFCSFLIVAYLWKLKI